MTLYDVALCQKITSDKHLLQTQTIQAGVDSTPECVVLILGSECVGRHFDASNINATLARMVR
jgi:hypothetical protein